MQFQINRVTWFSKLITLGLFLIAICLSFLVGVSFEQNLLVSRQITSTDAQAANTRPRETIRTNEDKRIYSNEEYGFMLLLPQEYQNLNVTISEEPDDEGTVFHFTVDLSPGEEWSETRFNVFDIALTQSDIFQKVYIVDENAIVRQKQYPDMPGSRYITKIGHYYFSWSSPQDCAGPITCELVKNLPKIFTSLEPIN